MSSTDQPNKFKRILKRVREEFDYDTYTRDHYVVKESPSGELRICCFVCGDTKFKLYVNPTKRHFHCFKCPFSSGKYDVFDFVSKTEGITTWAATQRLYREFSETTPDNYEEELDRALSDDDASVPAVTPIKVLAGMPEGVDLLEAEVSPENADFWRYLSARGITDEEALGMQLHYVPSEKLDVIDSKGKYRGDIGKRLVIPVYGGKHQLVSWQARVVAEGYDKHDKYMSAPESELAKTLWPYVKPASKRVYIVEGVFDCLACRRVEGISAYATFTKKISVEQIKLLKSWGVEEVVVFWDRKDSLADIKRAVPELQMQFVKVFVLDMKDWPKTQDAGNMLAVSDGTDKLREVLSQLVDTYSLDYTKWQMSF